MRFWIEALLRSKTVFVSVRWYLCEISASLAQSIILFCNKPYFRGSRDGAVVYSMGSSYVGWVCCWFSSLLRGFFSGYSGFPPSSKITFLNYILSGIRGLTVCIILVKQSYTTSSLSFFSGVELASARKARGNHLPQEDATRGGDFHAVCARSPTWSLRKMRDCS